MSEEQTIPWRAGDKVAVSGPYDVAGFEKPVYAVIRTEVARCTAKDISLGNCSGELGHTGDHYLTTIYGRANWGNDEEDDTEPERACVICGTPENGVYTSHNRCCWDADNIEEV